MQFDAATKKVYISAEELCHTVVNHGDIDVRGVRVRAGGEKIDEQLEQQYGLHYTRTVELSRTVSRGGLFYEISGICDGVIEQGGEVTVCVHRYVGCSTEQITAAVAAESIGVAVVYAYLLAERDLLPRIRFRVTFFHRQKDIKTIEKTYARAEMAEALYRLLDLHRPFAALEAERVCKRIPAAAAAAFPYREMRVGQRDFMIEVLRAVKNGGKAVIEAPTGIGKTMAALYPALKALGTGYVDKVFYFTSKNTTALAALEAVKKLSATTGVRAIHITAKDRACVGCVNDPFKCTPERCPRAAGHYARLADAIADIVTVGKVIDTDLLDAVAEKHSVCPYEFSLDLTELCDIVICDYNYLIDDAVHFRRYFGENAEKKGKFLLLFDEAHNLLERAKSSFGAELSLGEIRAFLSAFPGAQGAVIDTLAAVDLALDSMRGLCRDSLEEDARGCLHGFAVDPAFDKSFYELLTAFAQAADRLMRSPTASTLPPSFFALHSGVKKYLSALEGFDECFVHTVTVHGEEVISGIVCLDPSKRLAARMEKGVASVFFSATLTPLSYYASLYGAADGVKLKLDCPYDPKNLCVCILDKLSVRYQFRSQNATAVADAIAGAVRPRDGNYMVYFPSYAYMSEVQTVFKYKYPHIKVVMQERGMREESRRAFLDAFRKDTHTTLVGFSVLGGIYAEGIDLVGDRLIGSIIVGVGLVQPSNESEVLREYYEDKYEQGREYAYVYPGFNRVLQAAGRVIRTETDRGVVIFMDERYADPLYKELLPTQFRHAKFVGDDRSLTRVLDEFWEKS